MLMSTSRSCLWATVAVTLFFARQAAGFAGAGVIFGSVRSARPASRIALRVAVRCNAATSSRRALLQGSMVGGLGMGLQHAATSSRRALLQGSMVGGLGMGVQLLQPPAAAAVDEEEVDGEEVDEDETLPTLPKLASRFAEGQIKTIGPAGPLGAPDVTFPAWLAGTWDVTYTFERAAFPLSKDFAQFKQLLAGSVRSPGDKLGAETTLTLAWKAGAKGVEEDRPANLKNYFNAFSKDVTVDTSKGARTRKVLAVSGHLLHPSSVPTRSVC